MSSAISRNALAPTFSSTGNTTKIVSRLGPQRIATMIMSGKTNRNIPPEYQIDIDQFLPAAVSAVGEVTKCVSSGDWGGLEGLVDRECINNLKASMDMLNKEEKELVALNPGDVFLSFVYNQENCDSGNNLQMVTFSLPKLEKMKQMVKENKELTTEFDVKMKGGNVTDKEQLEGIMNEFQTKLTANDPHTIFAENEIVIGNYRFVRESPASQWIIKEVAQINSLQAWATPFKLRWKGRLGIATRGGYNFYNVLRMDYMSDYIMITCFMGFYIMQMLGSGIITAPHS